MAGRSINSSTELMMEHITLSPRRVGWCLNLRLSETATGNPPVHLPEPKGQDGQTAKAAADFANFLHDNLMILGYQVRRGVDHGHTFIDLVVMVPW